METKGLEISRFLSMLFFAMILLLAGIQTARAETVVWQESFETDGEGVRYTSSEDCNDGVSDFFTRTDGTDISENYEVTGADGDYYFTAQDTNGDPCTMSIETLAFEPVDISGFSGLTFKGLFAEDDDGDNQDWDDASQVSVEYQIDGGGWDKILQFAEIDDGDAYNQEPGLDTDFDGVGDSTPLTSTFAEFSASIPETGSTLEIRVTIEYLDDGDEDVAFDNFRVLSESTPAPGVTIAGSPVAVSEDGVEDSYTVALDTTPDAQVDIKVEALDGQTQVSNDDGTTYSDFVVLNLTDTTPATIYVRAVDDTEMESGHMGTITHTVTDSGDDYADIEIDDATANIADNDSPGTVTIAGSPVEISEDGIEDSYTVALDTTPSEQVDIRVEVFDGETQVSKDGGTTYANLVVLNLSDTTPATVHVRAIDDGEVEGDHTGAITHAASSDDARYEGISIDNAVANIKDTGITKIHEIQGDGEASPLAGDEVVIDGIVTGDYQGSSSLNGFFVQEEDADADADPTTSEGIFVYSNTEVQPGDRVQVKGTVKEYYDLTELSPVASATVIGSGNLFPMAAAVSLPASAQNDWEKYEGMLVEFSQTLYVTDHYDLGKYGEVALSAGDRLCQPSQSAETGDPANAVLDANELNQIVLDDASTASNPDPIVFSNNPPYELSAGDTLRGGDTVTGLSAVLGYGFDTYRLYPLNEQLPGFVNSNPRPTSAPRVGGMVTVATFNMLNYFTTLGSGNDCGPNRDQQCRGASTSSEFARQRDKLVAALTLLDADVVGLIELENTGQNAISDLVGDETGLAGYGYIPNPGGDGAALGSDAITVGMIYKTDTVAPVGGSVTVGDDFGTADLGEACGSGSDGVYPFDHYNRKPLAQKFQHIESQEFFAVVVNHFKSKGSLTGYEADEDQNDGQGANNCTRVQAAKALLEWLSTDPAGSGDAGYLVMGDLNSYAMEDPVEEFENAGYVNEARDYSYLYYGQWGSLDYILSSPGISPKVTGGAVWHINADEPRVLDYNEEDKTENQKGILYNADPYRSSDHDPVVVGLFDNICAVPASGNWDMRSDCTLTSAEEGPESLTIGPGASLTIDEGGSLVIGGADSRV